MLLCLGKVLGSCKTVKEIDDGIRVGCKIFEFRTVIHSKLGVTVRGGTHSGNWGGTVVSVAAGAGYWWDWAAPSRRLAPLMLHLAAPLLTPLLGYFPGKALRMVGDLPGPAMRQWTRWCRHPEFAWGAEPDLVRPSLQSARFRIEAFSFTDDDAMTENCTRKLLAAMPNVRSNLQVIEPQTLGLPTIGHIGAFRPQASRSLWPLLEQAMGDTITSGGSEDGPWSFALKRNSK